jgi:O-antigen/teichoic acid export membrane protein
MAVSLYTSRIVLESLGIVDFGIYNVVGGIVTMVGFLSSSLSSSTIRFMSFEIGRKDFVQLTRVFNMSINIQILLTLIIIITSETIGLWFINTQLVIPVERMESAKLVYQFSIFSFCINIIRVPFDSMIIASERMNVFAWVSIVEVSIKLAIVLVLDFFHMDKLELYAILVFGVSLITTLIYVFYVNFKFVEIQLRFLWDKLLFKRLIFFTGWNLLGDISYTLNGQGMNILLNMYFGPSVNAARGITYQIIGAVNSFVTNFQMAVNPQIIKSFSSNERAHMWQLVNLGAKYSFFLLLIISIPVLIETETLLNIWLKNVPKYTIPFTRLVILNILIESFSGPLFMVAQAIGRVKLYNLFVGGAMLSILPISYFFFNLGYPPESSFYVGICVSLLTLVIRLVVVNKISEMDLLLFVKEVIFKALIVAFFSSVLPLFISLVSERSVVRLMLVILVSLIGTMLSVFIFGLSKNEKIYFIRLFNKYLNRVSF